MASKSSAADGGQAAIGDIINNHGFGGLVGHLSGNIVIQNLHITTPLAAVHETALTAGLVAFFGLDEWWIEMLSATERGIIEDAIGPEVCRDKITSTNRSASSWLRGVAWRIGVVHQQLASKLRAKATWLETGVEIDDYWIRQLDTVRRHWQRMDFLTARNELRAVGYRMREENALPESHTAFFELQADLLRADPYYTEVMCVVLPIIESRPGIIQSTLAKGLQDIDIERFRHAMYYGEIIGDIKRVKNGRSYGLFLAKKGECNG